MHRRIAAGACWLLLLFFSSSATAEPGVILGFSIGEEVRLVSTASVARVAPARPVGAGAWRIVAHDALGRERWSRSFPAPRMFHGSADAIDIALAVPAIRESERLSITDEHGSERWSTTIDASLLSEAAERGRRLAGEVDEARKRTAASRHDVPRHDARADAPAIAMPGAPDARPDAGRRVAAGSLPWSGKGALALHLVRGTSFDNAQIRVFDASSGDFIVSMRLRWWDGGFEFLLPAGVYTFEADENRILTESSFFHRSPYRSDPIRVDRELQLPMLVQHDDTGSLDLAAVLPCTIANEQPVFQPSTIHFVEISASLPDGTRVERSASDGDGYIVVGAPRDVGDGACEVVYNLRLSSGVYDITMGMPGWEDIHWAGVAIQSGGHQRREHRFAADARDLVWSARIVQADGRPADFFTRVRAITPNRQALQYAIYLPEDQGNFVLPYRRGWRFDFTPIALQGAHAGRRYVLDGRPLPNTVQLEQIATQSVDEDGLLRIHGNGDRSRRYNLLFLAEGYTDLAESFEDRNLNGQWDGFAWIDQNGDGQFNDHYQPYGQPDYAWLQADDPMAGNEPFDDINGDGFLNRDEPAQFESNARDFMRALLGSDFWDEHRDAFNAYALFESSPQAGFDIVLEDGRVAIERDTRYHSNMSLPRRLMNFDRTAAMQRALVALPEVDMVVVLVHQPVISQARGNVSLSQPGVMIWPSGLGQRWNDDLGPSHEMGHYVAGLCDEYEEFDGVHPAHRGTSPACANVSYSPDPATVPWKAWITTPATTTPSRSLDGSIGIYEGADYYSGGAYRPSFQSTMRDRSPLFNAPSRAALEEALHRRTGRPHEVDSEGRCQRTPINAVHARHGC